MTRCWCCWSQPATMAMSTWKIMGFLGLKAVRECTLQYTANLRCFNRVASAVYFNHTGAPCLTNPSDDGEWGMGEQRSMLSTFRTIRCSLTATFLLRFPLLSRGLGTYSHSGEVGHASHNTPPLYAPPRPATGVASRAGR